ncbi:protein terminal ear1 homolog [Malania oleifera]|uniref:protein terminal ear1 homolog n=1 Tax=Malania oleifera TaxID=397392 RepID=UPI0025AE35BD|nr:protein terminal ear1 homolog [Malania oleifera]
MGETGLGNLDPKAQEFRPRNPYVQTQITTTTTTIVPPQVYFPYEVQLLNFCGGGGGVGYPHPQFPAPSELVRPAAVPAPPAALQLPPPSVTPTRAVLLSSVPPNVSESTVRRELEVFGEVRAVQMEKVREGMVAVLFYDLRRAQEAVAEIRKQHMMQQSRMKRHFDAVLARDSAFGRLESECLSPVPQPPPARGLVGGCAVWAQFMIPATSSVPDGTNQGTLVVFNLDSEVTATALKDIFQAFGPVKELRETPLKRNQRFVEFYDVRDAARALREMNGKEIHGKHVVIEFSRPGGLGRRFYNAAGSKKPSTSNSYGPSSCPQLPPPPVPRKISVRPESVSVYSRPGRFSRTQIQNSTKKYSACKTVSTRISSSSPAVEASMATLCISGTVSNGAVRSAKKYPPANTKLPQQQQSQPSLSPPSRIRTLKGRQKNVDSRFLIIEEAMAESSNCRDSRTTVMIKNIPNKYSQKLLLNMLDNHCIHCNEQIAGGGDQPLSSYDFVYLPIDFNNKCNVGYGFVNLTSPQATWRLYKAFHLQPWEVFNSRKICEVTYARLQGLEALKEHFRNSKFGSVTDDYLPVVFAPPRDGRQLTEPLPLVRGNFSARGGGDDHDDDGEMGGGDGAVVGEADDVEREPDGVGNKLCNIGGDDDEEDEVGCGCSSSGSNRNSGDDV